MNIPEHLLNHPEFDEREDSEEKEEMRANEDNGVEIKYTPNGEDDQDVEEVEVKDMPDTMTDNELTQERNGDEPF